MNKLSYILIGLAYILLSFAYAFRGHIGFGKYTINLEYRHMQIIVSIMYITIGYVYFADGVYHKFDDAFKNENENENTEDKKIKKRNKYIGLIALYIIIVIITYIIAKSHASIAHN
jgi:uncharacterized membrane protein